MKPILTLFFFSCVVACLAQNSGVVIGGQEYRPCDKTDVSCIKKYLAEHSHCKPTDSYGDEYQQKLLRRRSVSYLTAVNITATLDHMSYNFKAKVDDFFIDRENDKVVLVVTLKSIRLKSDDANFRFHRKGKEPVITKGTFYAEHGPIILTTSIPSVNNIKLKDSITFAFLTEPAPRILELSPSLFRSRDPEVKLASVEFIKRVSAITIEFFATEGAFIFANFVQHAICDFGLEVL